MLKISTIFRILKWIYIRKSLSSIKILVLDVDGVLTCGGMWINEKGSLFKRFNVKDGLGIRLLMTNHIKIVFISGGVGGATELRAKQLGINDCFVGVENKALALRQIQKKYKLQPKDTLFVGDDVNDMVVRPHVRLLISTADAERAIQSISDAVLLNAGGNGAIRELADKILKAKGIYNLTITNLSIIKND